MVSFERVVLKLYLEAPGNSEECKNKNRQLVKQQYKQQHFWDTWFNRL